jgi:hypothetical protein
VVSIEGDQYTITIDAFLDRLAARSDFSLLPAAEQRPPHSYFPMRKTLPYGRYICADGSFVLHNRDYEPLWRVRNGRSTKCNPKEWVEHARQEWFYSDSNPPWIDEATYAVCVQHLPSSKDVDEPKESQDLDLIPASVLALLGHKWRGTSGYSAFDSVIEDTRDRLHNPSYYQFSYGRPDDDNNGMTWRDTKAVIADGVYGANFRVRDEHVAVNEHAQHALTDFCSEVYDAWAKYKKRLASI